MVGSNAVAIVQADTVGTFTVQTLLSGKVAAAVVTGTSSSGMFDFIKHFGLNDQETNRASFLHTWATEQVVRELYNKPFEICIREARKTIRYTADENGTVATKVMRGCSADDAAHRTASALSWPLRMPI